MKRIALSFYAYSVKRYVIKYEAIHYKTKGSFFKEKFNRLAMRKSRKKALIAIARKLLVVIWNILKDKKEYNPHLMPIYDTVKLSAKIKYHQREMLRIEKLL